MPSRFVLPDPDAPQPTRPEQTVVQETLDTVRRAVLALPLDDGGNVHRRDVLDLLDDEGA